jgi:ubiquinone biosynthesis protein
VIRAFSLFVRFLRIAFGFSAALLGYGFRRLLAGRPTPEAREHLRGEALARLLSRLGATFIKFGQILSTRPDLLGPGFIEPLARLQDRVKPAPFATIERVLAGELSREARARLVSIEPEPVAAASVAQVHRARLDDGQAVALKVQRPEAESQVDRDLSILDFWAGLADRIPAIRMLSLRGAVERFGHALRGQLDFRDEALHNRRFAENFASIDNVGVPRLFGELCTRRVLGMEFVEGARATEPEKVGGDRSKLARLGGECVLKMIFEDGFVHADLHPGNIILTPDDRVVLIDLGMVSEIPRDLLRPWVETFLALSQQNGAECARLFYTHAPTVGNTDYEAFERDVIQYLERGVYGKRLGEVEVSKVVSGMMNILRRHRVQIDPAFTVVNIALLVAEGLGKQLDPAIDLMPMAMPYLTSAMSSAPAGRPPFREVPTRAAA